MSDFEGLKNIRIHVKNSSRFTSSKILNFYSTKKLFKITVKFRLKSHFQDGDE